MNIFTCSVSYSNIYIYIYTSHSFLDILFNLYLFITSALLINNSLWHNSIYLAFMKKCVTKFAGHLLPTTDLVHIHNVNIQCECLFIHIAEFSQLPLKNKLFVCR